MKRFLTQASVSTMCTDVGLDYKTYPIPDGNYTEVKGYIRSYLQAENPMAPKNGWSTDSAPPNWVML